MSVSVMMREPSPEGLKYGDGAAAQGFAWVSSAPLRRHLLTRRNLSFPPKTNRFRLRSRGFNFFGACGGFGDGLSEFGGVSLVLRRDVGTNLRERETAGDKKPPRGHPSLAASPLPPGPKKLCASTKWETDEQPACWRVRTRLPVCHGFSEWGLYQMSSCPSC